MMRSESKLENFLFYGNKITSFIAAGLHDHFNQGRFNHGRLSIEAFFRFKSFLITFDWLKCLDRNPAPIAVIM